MTGSFSADAARALPGPDWLRERRAAAAERFAATAWPSTDEEVWRYSRIAELDLDEWSLATLASAPSEVPAIAAAVLQLVPDRAASVVVAGGRAVIDLASEVGVTLIDVDGALGSVIDEPVDIFTTFNDAFAATPTLIDIPAGVTIDKPIVVVNVATVEGEAMFPRLVVRVGENARVNVVDVYLTAPGVDRALVVPITELHVGRGASLGHVTVQNLGLATWQVGTQVSSVAQDATLVSSTVALGGDYARQRTDCRLVGQGATGNLLAAYFGEGDQTLDFRTFQEHAAPDTTSNLLFKGAVGGRSRSVYTGLIRVRKNARGTNAFQTNRNIKLSDDAWAESVPNLEIENNDVHCSHASAVGPIDEEQRFYLESRGVPPAAAERLVVMGFFDEVLEQLPVASAMLPLREAVARKLDAT